MEPDSLINISLTPRRSSEAGVLMQLAPGLAGTWSLGAELHRCRWCSSRSSLVATNGLGELPGLPIQRMSCSPSETGLNASQPHKRSPISSQRCARDMVVLFMRVSTADQGNQRQFKPNIK
jgi:hypothetical protein